MNSKLHIRPLPGFQLATLFNPSSGLDGKMSEYRNKGPEDNIICSDSNGRQFKKVGATLKRDPRPVVTVGLPSKSIIAPKGYRDLVDIARIQLTQVFFCMVKYTEVKVMAFFSKSIHLQNIFVN